MNLPIKKKTLLIGGLYKNYKVGEIKYGNFYILEVDEQKISFNGGWNADYFEEHYKTLGYEVKRLNHNNTFGYDEGCPGCGCKDGNHAQECKVYYTKGYGKR